MYKDFSEAVPVPDYVRRDGVCNIGSHFPSNVVAPDLGKSLTFGIHRNLLLPGARLPRKPHHSLQLQDILFPDLTLILFAELLGQLDATVDVLRANVVGGDLDRVGKIGNLGWKVSIERRVGRIRLEKRT